MSESEIKKTLKNLNEKMDGIIARLDYLEQVIARYPDLASLSEVVFWFKTGLKMYDEPLKVLNRLLSLNRVVEEKIDDVSRAIIQSLALKGSMNISQITREVKAQRGKASRKTVRAKLKALMEKGLVEKTGHYFQLAQEKVAK
jgi:DNA-binding transcriptional ArsR family regulator